MSKLKVIGLCILALVVHPLVVIPLAHATSIPLRSLGEMARHAPLSFAGTVGRISYRTADGRPLTDVRFTQVSFARGQGKGDTPTLSLWGGVDGKEFMSITGMPEFEVGKRYVVLATDQGTSSGWYIPIPDLTQGVFRVDSDIVTKRTVMRDWGGRAIAGIEGEHIKLIGHQKRQYNPRTKPPPDSIELLRDRNGEPLLEVIPEGLDPGTRVSETQFLQAITRLGGGG
jgi:hypothetical protein